jgi:NAD-dependent SIR2 family protein deacetylase
MIEEELKQEAEKSLDKRLGTYAYIRKQDCYTNYVDGYIDSAEPREKRIAELEQQIEKMKCCYNCSKWNDGQCADIPNSSYYSADFVCEDWEMKENE